MIRTGQFKNDEDFDLSGGLGAAGAKRVTNVEALVFADGSEMDTVPVGGGPGYTLPLASDTTRGGLKIGTASGFIIDVDEKLQLSLGDGLQLVAGNLTLKLAAGLVLSAAGLAPDVNSTLLLDGSNKLGVKIKAGGGLDSDANGLFVVGGGAGGISSTDDLPEGGSGNRLYVTTTQKSGLIALMGGSDAGSLHHHDARYDSRYVLVANAANHTHAYQPVGSYATLDGTGKLTSSQIPALTSSNITNFATDVQAQITSSFVLGRLAGQTLSVGSLVTNTLAPASGTSVSLTGAEFIINKSGGIGQLVLTGGGGITSTNNTAAITGFGQINSTNINATTTLTVGSDVVWNNGAQRGRAFINGSNQVELSGGWLVNGTWSFNSAPSFSTAPNFNNGANFTSANLILSSGVSIVMNGGAISGAGTINGSGFALTTRPANYFDLDSDGVRMRLNGGGFMISNGFSGCFWYSSGFVGSIWMKNNAYTLVSDVDLQLGNNGFAKKNLYCGAVVTSWSDVAEEVPSPAEDLEPGDLAIIDPTFDEAIKKHAGSQYDITVAGVVSTFPGVVLGSGWGAATGEPSNDRPETVGSDPSEVPPAPTQSQYEFDPQKTPLALTGRVPCKVTTTYINSQGATVRRPIQRGFLLVSSSIPGHAMAADPSDFANGSIPQGTIIGKAMQAWDPAEGEDQEGVIKVWVNLG